MKNCFLWLLVLVLELSLSILVQEVNGEVCSIGKTSIYDDLNALEELPEFMKNWNAELYKNITQGDKFDEGKLPIIQV